MKKKTRASNPGLQAILENCNQQDSTVLAQEQTSDQWNRIEDPEMDPQTYSQLIFDKGGKNIQWNKDRLFRQKIVLQKLDSEMWKNEPGPLSYIIHKNNLNMDERPKCKQEAIKILEEKADKKPL